MQSHRQFAPCRFGSQYPCGFTVVELLVATGIIMILIGLLLPAVQMAREAARRIQCTNHLHNIGIAALSHESAHGYLPSDGWGYRWVGDPDRGFGANQPGGWIFNLLPYVEQEEVRRLGKGEPPAQKVNTFASRFGYAFDLFYCPSRRSRGVFPYTETSFQLVNSRLPATAAKSDYAISAGSVEVDGGPGPRSYLDAAYRWPPLDQMNGVSFVRSQVRASDVRDGMSRTILVGEKHVPIDAYLTGSTVGDDQGIYIGDDADIRRFTVVPPQPDAMVDNPPGGRIVHAFGSAHPSSTQFVMCDGSVERISFEVDVHRFRLMGGRYDGGRAFRRP